VVRRRADLATLAIAVVVHAGFAVALAHEHLRARAPASTVELEFKRPPPPVAAGAPAAPAVRHAPEPPAPHRKLALRARPTAAPAPASAPSAAPPAARPAPAVRPIYGVAMASTTEVASAVAVPVGGTALADPAARGGGRGRPALAGPVGEGEGAGDYHPASESDVSTMPEIDTDACGRTIVYPTDAQQAGVEGDVRLRIALNPDGRVHTVSVLAGLGHGLDRVAVEAIKHRCHFSPALGHDGRPVAFVVESYTFHFELPR